MSLTATFNADLARVRLAVTDLDLDTARVLIQRFDTAVLTNAHTVRGGDLDPADDTDFTRDDYEFTPSVVNTYEVRSYDGSDVLLDTFTTTITPVLDSPWLKSLTRPFLNRPITVLDFSDVERPARGAVFEIQGRRLPIAVTEVRGSRRFELTLACLDVTESEALELFLSFGDVVLVQTPADCPVPGPLYAHVGDISTARKSVYGARRYITLPLTEVAPPGELVIGFTATYAGLTSAFATYADLAAALPTYLDVAEYVSAPSDETVG